MVICKSLDDAHRPCRRRQPIDFYELDLFRFCFWGLAYASGAATGQGDVQARREENGIDAGEKQALALSPYQPF